LKFKFVYIEECKTIVNTVESHTITDLLTCNEFVVIFDEIGAYIGILTVDDISKMNGKLNLNEIPYRVPLDVNDSFTVFENFHTKLSLDYYPVFKNGELYGVLENKRKCVRCSDETKLVKHGFSVKEAAILEQLLVYTDFSSIFFFRYDVEKSRFDLLSNNSQQLFNVDLENLFQNKETLRGILGNEIAVRKSIRNIVIGRIDRIEISFDILFHEKGKRFFFLSMVSTEKQKKSSFPKYVIGYVKDTTNVFDPKFNKCSQRKLDNNRIESLHESNSCKIVSKDKKIKAILSEIECYSKSDATILLLGETGTGKELFAQLIHEKSNVKSNAPFFKINCAAIPENLLESVLFGHERGAFTGAVQTTKGKFELADGGTIFLDEIGEMPLSIQPKLLRVLQDKSFERVGGNRTIFSNVRIIAATNRDLSAEVQKGNFRQDLYYRINIIPIEIPPLRNRKNDIIALAHHFISKFNKKYNKNVKRISKTTIDKMLAYSWPGNVRELENIIERNILLSRRSELYVDPLSFSKQSSMFTENCFQPLEEVEKEYILNVLEKTSWKISGPGGAADILGLNRSTLNFRMNKLGIKKER